MQIDNMKNTLIVDYLRSFNVKCIKMFLFLFKFIFKTQCNMNKSKSCCHSYLNQYRF